MLRRVLLYTLAGLTGAGLTAALAYLGFHTGWLAPGKHPDAAALEQEAAREALHEHLRSAQTQGELRGVLVRQVEVVEGRPVVVGLVDHAAQAALLEEEGQAFLAEKGWQDRFPGGAVTARVGVYPLLSRHLPDMRRQFASAASRVPHDRVLACTRIDALVFGRDGRVHVQGVSLAGQAGASADDVRSLAAGEVRAFLRERPAPGPWAPLVVAREVQVLPNPAPWLTAELQQEPRFAGVCLANPTYDGAGVLRLDGVVPHGNLAGAVEKWVRARLRGHESVRAAGGEPAVTLALAAVDAAGLPARLQARLAASGSAVLERTRLDRAEVRCADGGSALVLRLQGVSIHPGMTAHDRKELAGVLADEAGKLFGKIPFRIDPAGVEPRPNPALELQGVAGKRANLRGVRVDLFRFDGRGRLVRGYSSATAEQKKELEELEGRLAGVRTLAGRGQAEEQEADGPGEELHEVSTLEEEKPAALDAVVGEIQALLARDEELRYTRLDGLRLGQDAAKNPEVVVSGVNIRAADEKALAAVRKDQVEKKLLDLLKKEIPARYRAGGKPVQVRLASGANAADKAARASFRVLVNPCPAWQNDLAARPEFDGLLLKAGFYDAKGALQLGGITAGAKQEAAVKSWLLMRAAGEGPDAIVLGPLGRRDPEKDDTPIVVKPRFALALTAVDWAGWKQALQEALAADTGKLAGVLHGTRLDRLVWRYKGPAPRVAVEGVVLHAGDKDQLRKDVQNFVEANLLGRFEKDKPGGIDRPLVEATQLAVHPNPLRDLRVKAVKDPALAGTLLADASFDGKGRLVVQGVAATEAQRKQIQAAFDKPLRAGKALPEGGSVDVAGMRVLSGRQLAGQLQEAFAAGAVLPLRRTRIDAAAFRYTQAGAGEPQAKLYLEGVSLTPPASAAALHALLVKEVNAALKLPAPLTAGEVDAAKLAHLENPAQVLQQEVRGDAALRGTLFAEAHYTAKGDLQVDAWVPDAAMKPAVVKWIEGEKVQKAARTPAGEDRKAAAVVRPVGWKSGAVKDWAGFVRALQAALARSEGEAGRAFRQTRLDGAVFVYENDRPALRLDGVTLFDPRALLASNKDLAEKVAKEKDGAARARLVRAAADAGLRKPTLDALQDKLLREAQALTGNLGYGASAGGVALVESPYEALQHRLRHAGVLLTGFAFDVAGKLVPLSALEITPLRRRLIEQAVRKYGPAPLRPSSEKETSHRRSPRHLVTLSLCLVAYAADDETDTPWLDLVKAWQRQMSGGSDRLLRQTRLDQASLDYDDAGKVVLVVEGAHLGGETDRGPLADALHGSTKESLRLGRSYHVTFSPTEFRFSPDPVLAMQQLAVSRNLDGLLFYNSRFTEVGVLRIDVQTGSEAQNPAVDEILKARPAPAAVLSARDGERLKVGPPRNFDWARMLTEVRQQFAGTADNLLARHTRLDRAFFAYGKDSAALELRWQGVCIHPTDETPPALRAAVARQIAALKAQLPTLDGMPPPRPGAGRYAVVTAGVALEPNPTRALQQQVLFSPENDGILFEDAFYPADGRLRMSVLLADRRQLKAVEAILKENPLPPAVAARTPGEKMHPLVVRTFDLKAVIAGLQRRLATAEGVQGRLRIDRGWFGYPAAPRDVVEFHVGGVLLGPIEPARKKEIEGRVLAETPGLLPRVSGSKLRVRPELVVRPNPKRGLQALIATTPALDGAGVRNAYFEPDGKMVLVGFWRSATQQPALHRLAAVFLGAERLVSRPDEFFERFTVVRTDEVLAGLRRYTADALDEVWVERLYFDREGVLTIRGVVAYPAEVRLVRAKLLQLVAEHPQLKGSFTVDTIGRGLARGPGAGTPRATVRPVAYRQPAPAVEPGVDLRVRPPVTPLLRARVQCPAAPALVVRAGALPAGPPRRWDGMLLRRGYYNPEGRFGLEGLCDSARQRADLGELMRVLAEDAPFREAFALGVDLGRLRALPLRPMLRGLRVVMPAYPVLDGITLEGACQDVDNRLVLRVVVVGPLPGPAVVELLRRQVAGTERWRERVSPAFLRLRGPAGPVRLVVLERLRPNDAVAEPLVLRSISTLRRGVGDLFTLYCPAKNPAAAAAYRQGEVSAALKMLDAALQYDTRDATPWFLRALCYYEQGDRVLCERDLRRMVEVETAEADGNNRRVVRLRMTELLQGDFRRALARLRKRVAGQILEGRPPLQLADVEKRLD
jgi:hypothetical protein